MRSLTLTPAEIAALQSSPTLLLQAINDSLGQARFLVAHYQALTGKSLDLTLPADVSENGANAIGDPGGGPAYGANGLTAPRADGAVRCRAWDEAVAEALASRDPVVEAWGRERAAQPWMFIQDTLTAPGISLEQKRAIGTNCSIARFQNGLTGSSYKGFSWIAIRVYIDSESGSLKTGDEIPDAFAVNDDLVNLAGKVMAKGYWAADMGALADRSLAHFVLTSGQAVLLALRR